jgi:predicted dinucleotide-binding enzyme
VTKPRAPGRRAVISGLGAGLMLGAVASPQSEAAATTADGARAPDAVAQASAPKASDVSGVKEPIAIIGTGRLGGVLGKRWAASGHAILFGSRTPRDDRVKTLVKDCGARASARAINEAAAGAAIVVLALPWKAVKDVLRTVGDLTGKVVIDPMNDVKMVDGYPQPSPDVAMSVGEELQSLVPGAHVVKAFNTPAARTIANPARGGGPLTIPLAGADATAKARVATLVAEIGFEPLDTGPLVAARYLEGMMLLSLGYYFSSKKAFEFYLRPVTG